MKITELRGTSQVFTQKDGKTFRILARQSKDLDESKISSEMKIAENMGLISMTKIITKLESKSAQDKPVEEETPTFTKKKQGGAK